jgi:hypothetical protein
MSSSPLSSSPLKAAHESCANCGAHLAGPWCSQCGQHSHESGRRLRDLLHDAWHSFTHLDGRFGSTLQLLFLKPGALTREYFANRRARHVPPFRLYLVCSLVFFALTSAEKWYADHHNVQAPGPVVFDVEKTDADPCEFDLGTGKAPAWVKTACDNVAKDQGKTLGKAFLGNAPKMMFLFLPLLAALMQLAYWRPRRWYVEHVVFSLHTHALLFTGFSLAMLLGLAATAWHALAVPTTIAKVVLFFWLAIYPYRAMRVYYGQTRARTLVKFTGLGVLYFTLLAAVTLLTIVVSAIGA